MRTEWSQMCLLVLDCVSVCEKGFDWVGSESPGNEWKSMGWYWQLRSRAFVCLPALIPHSLTEKAWVLHPLQKRRCYIISVTNVRVPLQRLILHYCLKFSPSEMLKAQKVKKLEVSASQNSEMTQFLHSKMTQWALKKHVMEVVPAIKGETVGYLMWIQMKAVIATVHVTST